MTTQKLMMFAVAGLLLPAADAAAQRAPKTTMIIPHPTADKAPTTGTAPNLRLKRTDEEQPGAENNTVAFFADGKTGLAFVQSTELPGVNAGDPVRGAPRRMQLALVPFSLVQDPTDGSVSVAADAKLGRFVTNNNGNEYRNANAPVAFSTPDGDVCVRYNYQANNTNDTKNYIQCFGPQGQNLLPQTEAFAKNNDDCSMAETTPKLVKKTGNVSSFVTWHGCNGNGRDDAWVGKFNLTKQANGSYTYARAFDVSVLAQEERSRGECVVGPDASFAVCAGTQGNTQPQREGSYLLAVDMSDAIKGENRQEALLWRKQIAGRAQLEGKNTYAMRAMINGIKTLDAQGNLAPTDTLFWRHGALQGNNRNGEKGGQYIQSQVAVIKFTREGMSYVTPQAGLAYSELLGIDGTHNLNTFALVGQGNDLKPAIFVQSGSHTGGNGTSQIRVVAFDQAANKFTNVASLSGAPFDHHYYPNLLGNNPNNQGRNQATASFIKNPFFGQGNNNDRFLLINATTAKGAVTDPSVKLAAYVSVTPVASGAAPATPGTPGTGGNTGGNNNGGGEGEGEGSDGSDTTLGGCSTGGSAGFATFFLIGLAAFIRRRR